MTDYTYEGPPTGLGNVPTSVAVTMPPQAAYGTYPLPPTDPYPMPKTNVVVKRSSGGMTGVDKVRFSRVVSIASCAGLRAWSASRARRQTTGW